MMRRLTLFFLLMLLITGCAEQVEITSIPHELYTELAKTVSVRLTQSALLTPSVTPTGTATQTATQTPTPPATPILPTPTATWSYHARREVDAPILAFHHIADNENDYPDFDPAAQDQISSAVFREQITELRREGYDSITMDLLINTLLYGSEMPQKPVVITFDSTAEGIYTKAFPILQEAGYVGNVFLTVEEIDQDGMLNIDQVKEMIAAGWQVGSHGLTGRDLTVDHSIISAEISGSRLKLEELLGVQVTVFSYPFGRTDDVILSRVSTWGYLAALGLNWTDTTVHSTQTLYYLSRINILNDGPLS